MTNRYLEKVAEWERDPEYMSKALKYGIIGTIPAPGIGTILGAAIGHAKDKKIDSAIENANSGKDVNTVRKYKEAIHRP